MTTRAQFLAAVRPGPPALSRLVPQPEVRYGDVDETGFTRRWEALGGQVHRCRPEDLDGVVAGIVAGRGPVLVGSDDLVAHLPADLRWPECGTAGAAAAGVAVVGAVAAIAATASVVLDARRAGGRCAALLAPAAVFVVRRSALLPTPAHVFRRTSQLWPEGLPSQVVLVSGPSRSADIEMTLTRGVHGPGEVHAVFVDDSAAG